MPYCKDAIRRPFARNTTSNSAPHTIGGLSSHRKIPYHRLTSHNRDIEMTECESIETTVRTRRVFIQSVGMSRLALEGTAESVSRDQILRRELGQGNIHFHSSADHEQDWQPYPVDLCLLYIYIYICDHTYIYIYEQYQVVNTVACTCGSFFWVVRTTVHYVCVRVVILVILDVRLVDAPAGVRQEEGHTGFLPLSSAVLVVIFLSSRIQPFPSLVDREIEFCELVLTIQSFSTCWDFFLFSFCEENF